MANQTAVPLDFIVIGGSSAGLSAAYALRRVGHRVLVLEQGPDFFDVAFSLFGHPLAGSDLFYSFNLRRVGLAGTGFLPTCPRSFTTGAYRNASANSASGPTGLSSVAVSLLYWGPKPLPAFFSFAPGKSALY